jgi:predicted nucleic acid-binding protein
MDKNLKSYLLDTNIVIYYWKGGLPEHEIDRVEGILKSSFIISVITKIELLGWRKHTEEGFAKAKEFIDKATVVPVDEELADFAINLRRNNDIKLADSLIAATAMCNDLILVTRNEKDFFSLRDLEIYNPFKDS